MPETTNFQFKIYSHLDSIVSERAKMLEITKAGVINKDLDTYYQLLTSGKRSLDFSESEAMLIIDACNSFMFDSVSFKYLGQEILDAIKLDGIDKKWGVVGEKLITKLQALGIGEKAALADAILNWRALTPYEREQKESLKKIGLMK